MSHGISLVLWGHSLNCSIFHVSVISVLQFQAVWHPIEQSVLFSFSSNEWTSISVLVQNGNYIYHDYLFSDGFLFLLFQASIFEALTQSFQVAFALRSYSLTDAGNIVDRLQVSLVVNINVVHDSWCCDNCFRKCCCNNNLTLEFSIDYLTPM
jgi:hypothetical protein